MAHAGERTGQSEARFHRIGLRGESLLKASHRLARLPQARQGMAEIQQRCHVARLLRQHALVTPGSLGNTAAVPVQVAQRVDRGHVARVCRNGLREVPGGGGDVAGPVSHDTEQVVRRRVARIRRDQFAATRRGLGGPARLQKGEDRRQGTAAHACSGRSAIRFSEIGTPRKSMLLASWNRLNCSTRRIAVNPTASRKPRSDDSSSPVM